MLKLAQDIVIALIVLGGIVLISALVAHSLIGFPILAVKVLVEVEVFFIGDYFLLSFIREEFLE